jgi:phenylpropionate dioxygenase-like ring-hydroxylating dioxygenase large terminal subunit
MNETDITSVVNDVRAGWLPAHIYSDAGLYGEEQKRLFGRTWQFVGHESEIPNPGDYVVRQVLNDSFIVIRGEDGQVRAHLNMCRHRGMQICRSEKGSAKRLTCPYHMWSYNAAGELAGVPFHDEAYGGESELSRKETSLVPAPRLDTFGGLIFVSMDEAVLPLREYLGDFAQYLSFYTSPSSEGIEFRGPQRWRVKANWKISSENFAGDSYHTPHTHASVAEIGIMSAARGSSRKGGAVYHAGHGAGATFKLDDGTFEQRLASIGYAPEMIRSRAEHWPDAVKLMIGRDGFIPSAATVFPNLSMLHLWARIDEAGTLAPFTTFRLWKPVSETETETMSWFAVDKGATPEFKEASYKAYLMCFGSAGMFEQDDMENWALVTKMAQGQLGRQMHLHNRMGLRSDGSSLADPLRNFPGGAIAHVGFNEHNQRRWMAMWCEYLERPPVSVVHCAFKRGGRA